MRLSCKSILYFVIFGKSILILFALNQLCDSMWTSAQYLAHAVGKTLPFHVVRASAQAGPFFQISSSRRSLGLGIYPADGDLEASCELLKRKDSPNQEFVHFFFSFKSIPAYAISSLLLPSDCLFFVKQLLGQRTCPFPRDL